MESKMTTTFHDFKKALDVQFVSMAVGDLFTVTIDKDEMWEEYLASFAEGTNPIYKERTVHDCQCCKQFVRSAGAVVAIKGSKLESIWNVNVSEPYATVAKHMKQFIEKRMINNKFLHYENFIGTDHNRTMDEKGKVVTFEHFHFNLHPKVVSKKADRDRGLARTNYTTLKRALDEITDDAVQIVLELINQGSVYRGEEHKSLVELLNQLKLDYAKADNKNLFTWEQSSRIGPMSGICNTVIGTLLTDISKGIPLDDAVRMFESKVAPQNYKRPSALITKSMIEHAKTQIETLNLTAALSRRHAMIDDIDINDALFVYRDVHSMLASDVFGEMVDEIPDKFNLAKVEEIDSKTFLSVILPGTRKLEILLDNEHENSFVSLIAPTDKHAKHMFKWNNPYSWIYNGNIADSVKMRVKAAGGSVTGALRCSLSWFNTDDLDLHLKTLGYHIYHAKKSYASMNCSLDVDMNVQGNRRDAVENITWPKERDIQEAEHHFYVNNYTLRENIDVGFEAEIEFRGVIHKFAYTKPVKADVTIAKFRYSKQAGLTFTETLPRVDRSKEIWGLTTNKFHPVSLVTKSPNFWGNSKVGNEHLFFIISNCINNKSVRGFLNEYLHNDLNEFRKVFEVLGSKTLAPVSDNQLSGVGFSTTIRRSVYFKVTGSFSRIIKVNF